MIRAVLYALLTAGLVCGAIWLSANPGEVTVNWLGYRMNTSVVLLLLGLAAIIVAVKIILLPFSIISFVKKEHSASRRKAGQKLLVEILSAAAAADEDKYKSLEKRINSTFADNPTLKSLLLLNVTKGAKRLEVLNQMTADEDTEMAAFKVRIDEALAANRKGEALALYRNAFISFPKVNRIAVNLISLLGFFGEWDELIQTADKAYAKGAVSKNYMLAVKSSALLERGIQNNNAKDIIAAAKLDKDNVEAQIKAAFDAEGKGENGKALKILLGAWKRNTVMPIYDAIVFASRGYDKIKRFKLMQKIAAVCKGKPVFHLVMADAYAVNAMTGAARAEIDKYLLLYPTSVRAIRIMAQIEKTDNPASDAAVKWNAKAAGVEGAKPWLCSSCRKGFAEWHAVCPDCNAFAAIYPVTTDGN